MTITFEELETALEAESYPLTAEELKDSYGDEELDLAGGEEAVGDALDRIEAPEFETATDALETISTGIDVDGVGRVAYTDRGTSVGENGRKSL